MTSLSPTTLSFQRVYPAGMCRNVLSSRRMIAIAKQSSHPIDVILVWKYSRFARNQEESIVYKSMLKKDNVDVISVSEPLIDGPFGTLIERIIEWMDEYYSIRLSGEVLTRNERKGLAEWLPDVTASWV